MCLVQQGSDGRRLPLPTTTHRPLPHLVQLRGDVAQRQSRIGDSDRSNQLHEMILRGATRRPGKQTGIGQLLARFRYGLDRFRSALAQAGISGKLAPGFRLQSGSLRGQRPTRWQGSYMRCAKLLLAPSGPDRYRDRKDVSHFKLLRIDILTLRSANFCLRDMKA